jgi:hypothetical protein
MTVTSGWTSIPTPEFDAWRWADLPALVVGFKRPIYQVLATAFARFATVS